MKKRAGKSKGLTLVEVLVAVAFIGMVYAFVVQLFFDGFKDINMGDIQEEAARLATNEMVRLSSIENPLYIGLLEMPGGQDIIDKLKSGEILPSQLIDDQIINPKTYELVGAIQVPENNMEISSASNQRAVYERKVEWCVEDVDPPLIKIRITVAWVDSRKEIVSDDFVLETQLAK